MDRREHFDDIEEGMRLAIEAAQARLWTALPGLVQSVDLAKQTVSVQPAIRGAITHADGSVRFVAMPMLVDVPIMWPRAGGFALTLPVAVGDDVLVVFASRCIDAWWQNGGQGAPIESRMHDLSDGFAIFAPTSQPKTLANVQADGIELRTEARDIFIKLTATGIQIQGNIILTGNLTQTGNMTHSGGSFTSGGKNVGAAHTHSGVTPGGGSTGAPN